MSIFLLYLISNGLLNASAIPLFGIYLAAAYRLVPSIARIVQAVQTMQFNLKCAKNLKDEIEKFVELEKIGNNDKEVRFHNKIQVKNLTFNYNLENDKKNLNNSTFVIPCSDKNLNIFS